MAAYAVFMLFLDGPVPLSERRFKFLDSALEVYRCDSSIDGGAPSCVRRRGSKERITWSFHARAC